MHARTCSSGFAGSGGRRPRVRSCARQGRPQNVGLACSSRAEWECPASTGMEIVDAALRSAEFRQLPVASRPACVLVGVDKKLPSPAVAGHCLKAARRIAHCCYFTCDCMTFSAEHLPMQPHASTRAWRSGPQRGPEASKRMHQRACGRQGLRAYC